MFSWSYKKNGAFFHQIHYSSKSLHYGKETDYTGMCAWRFCVIIKKKFLKKSVSKISYDPRKVGLSRKRLFSFSTVFHQKIKFFIYFKTWEPVFSCGEFDFYIILANFCVFFMKNTIKNVFYSRFKSNFIHITSAIYTLIPIIFDYPTGSNICNASRL